MKLENKIALITGGSSGIEKAISLCYIKEKINNVKIYIKIHFSGSYVDFILLIISAFYIFRNPLYTFEYIFCLSIWIFGVIFWLWSRIQLGNSFSIVPKAINLIQYGIYSKIRNPMYFFSFIAVLGMAFYLNNFIGYIFLMALFVVQFLRSKQEEKILKKKFGVDYNNYKKQTWF